MSDLISRIEVESVLHNNLHALIDTDQLYQLYRDINRLPTYSTPPADIIEHARAIKKYCKDRMGCAKCRFNIECNGRSVCRLYMNLPIWWDLPEGGE